MRDEDLDRCPRCKEDMWKWQKICCNCQREDELEEWPGGDGIPFSDGDDPEGVLPDEITCSECGCATDDREGRHYCCEDNSDD